MGHNFKTARKNSTTFFQHVFNHYVNFQSKWTTNVEMTVALRLGVEKSNIVDTSNIGCVWHALCTVFCWNAEVPGLSLAPNCHNYHLRYNLNWCIAQLSSCSDSNIQQTGLAQKDIPLAVLITMALIATWDFHRVSSKRIGEIVNSGINDLEIKAHRLMGRYVYEFPQRKCVWGLFVKQLRLSISIYCSYSALIKARYRIFRHPFLKHLAFPEFWSDSIEILYANSKHVEFVWYEVARGYVDLIQIYDVLKIVPFFVPLDIYQIY